MLREIITKHVVTQRLVNTGTEWVLQYYRFTPTEWQARKQLIATKYEDGSLALRVPKV